MDFVNKAQNAVTGAAEGAALLLTPKYFQDGICSCCDDSMGCLDVYCCTYCSIGRQCAAMDGNPDKMDIKYCCCSFLLSYFGGYTTFAFFAGMIRQRVVDKYNVQLEGPIKTWALACCCAYCSLCQTHRALTSIGTQPGNTVCQTTVQAGGPTAMSTPKMN